MRRQDDSTIGGFASVLLALWMLASFSPRASGAERDGFLFGFTLGRGRFDCQGCLSSGAHGVGLHAGGALGKNASLAGEILVATHEEPTDTRLFSEIAAVVQYWPLRRLWVGGGLGFGHHALRRGDTTESLSSSEFGFVIQAGIELVQSDRGVVDIRARYGRNNGDPPTAHAMLSAGFTWY